MARCTPLRTRAAAGEEAGEAGAAARCCCRADGNVALAAMLDAGTGTAGVVGVAAPPALVRFTVLAPRGAVSVDDDDDDDDEEETEEEELDRESGYGGGRATWPVSWAKRVGLRKA